MPCVLRAWRIYLLIKHAISQSRIIVNNFATKFISYTFFRNCSLFLSKKYLIIRLLFLLHAQLLYFVFYWIQLKRWIRRWKQADFQDFQLESLHSRTSKRMARKWAEWKAVANIRKSINAFKCRTIETIDEWSFQ